LADVAINAIASAAIVLRIGLLRVLPLLPTTNAKRLRKGAKATKQSTPPQMAEWIASLRSQ
jgi:hypothetical protein